MPDVSITCPSCGKSITVSEFVDLSQLVCRSCGGRFVAQQEQPAHGVDESIEEDHASEPVVTITGPEPVVVTAKVQAKQRSRFRWTYQLKCWTVFASVAIVALTLRYGGLLGEDALATLVEYGPYCIVAMHLYITFRAFRESVLSGILSLLVPFYSVYYAFWCFEDYMFRAVYGGILVGTGMDFLAVFFEKAKEILPAVNDFFTSGL
jgi:hypothetical protein